MAYKARLIGYIVRSKTNPAMILCSNGEWHSQGVVGPALEYGAKLYKTRRNAEKVRGGEVIVEEQWV